MSWSVAVYEKSKNEFMENFKEIEAGHFILHEKSILEEDCL